MITKVKNEAITARNQIKTAQDKIVPTTLNTLITLLNQTPLPKYSSGFLTNHSHNPGTFFLPLVVPDDGNFSNSLFEILLPEESRYISGRKLSQKSCIAKNSKYHPKLAVCLYAGLVAISMAEIIFLTPIKRRVFKNIPPISENENALIANHNADQKAIYKKMLS